jgi:hypothetical protein
MAALADEGERGWSSPKLSGHEVVFSFGNTLSSLWPYIPGCDHDPTGHRIDLNLERSAACGLVLAPVCLLVIQT